ncbi:DUF2065 domain-containing protein [Sulfitobacter sp. M57]|uniref:DUF2065 domain-containing protein n=1 Tax=unclassified Sulfitobacter TaxID=196795 RepID=UPI0023E2E7E8|nr:MULTISPECIES: DUF2065 domain-containing protein [unclassified Sulfitobacter]MDF3414190.1 DUF2065 domain-containing protein [Sulfitobacter sp. KE5]MDF3420529.1 DUF2065 domain-containing protein [Sulfitobacter sp. KE43]MDF3432736.1 DUF2065 domain-containing protein [Sulfitobacter sp. KE42]MDF3458375.1 DUF2065 domain-containing protein [Sulfitobacter sp. S74]MDF3462276.1 DUF2065 domain-containing protein [Sulfitobacter sp. Ks18]
MSLIFLAFGLVMIFEGLVYALAPSFLERMLEALRQMPEAAVRQIGFLVIVAGLIFVWIAFQIGA